MDQQNPPPDQPSVPPPAQPAGNVTPLPYATPGIEMNRDARTMGMLCHLLALSGYIIPIGWIVGPLVIWLIKKDQYEFVDDQGKESLNFHITSAIAAIASVLLAFVLIGIPLLIAVVIFNLVVTIIATVKANEGIRYRYPLCIRFIK